jgi:type IV pilus assembly protein PilC
VTTILLIYVIPEFETLFQGFGADLPAFTRFVIDISNFVQTRGWILLLAGVGGVLGLLHWKKRSRSVQHFFDR